MTEKRPDQPEHPRGYTPIYEKLIPAVVIILILVSVGMLVLAGGIALGLIGGA
jgi:hypothetical protein